MAWTRSSALRLVVIAALLFLLPRRADADESSPVSLSWTAPVECPDAAYVHGTIRRLLTTSAASTADQPVLATATVTRGGNVWRAEIVTETRGVTRRRALEGATCQAVADASALVLAMLVNPEKVSAHHAHEDSEPEVRAVRKPENPPPSPPPAPPPPMRTLFGTVEVLGGMDVGTMPSVGAGAGIGLGAVWSAWRMEMLGLAQPYETVSVSSVPGVGARFRIARSGPRGCYALFDGPIALRPCAGAELVWMRANGTGLGRPAQNETMWGEVVAGVGVRWAFLPHMGLSLDAAAQIPIRRRDVVIAQIGVVHTVPALTTRATIALDTLF
jgi:hypothetical protein